MIVKGHLKAFWKNVNANSFVIDTFENGYKIPFFSKPPSCFMKNNNTGAIQDLLHKGLIEKSKSAPYIVNPLSLQFLVTVKKFDFGFKDCKQAYLEADCEI